MSIMVDLHDYDIEWKNRIITHVKSLNMLKCTEKEVASLAVCIKLSKFARRIE